MLKKFDFHQYNETIINLSTKDLCKQLASLQRRIIEQQIPVLIIVDGWGGAGKGYVISKIREEMDPRFYQASLFEMPTEEEQQRPFLWRFWKEIPPKGHMAFFDQSFYHHLLNDYKLDTNQLVLDINDINSIERQLYNNHTVIIKFFLHLSKSTQKEILTSLENDPNRKFAVTRREKKQNENYREYEQHFSKVLSLSNLDYSPWHIINMKNKKHGVKELLFTTIQEIEKGLATQAQRQEALAETPYKGYKGFDLADLDLAVNLPENKYDALLDDLQDEAQQIFLQLFQQQIPTILIFEGTDAAGKGGAIKTLTKKLDARGYKIYQTSAPSQEDKRYHYMYRFMQRLPKKGHMLIFDRSWYGRVLVERVEGFATVQEWQRAYHEINEIEHHLVKSGVNLMKFYLVIDKNEQLRRFNDRQDHPEKSFKLTDEDWRHRAKWDDYLTAVNEMVQKTSTDHAPWIMVEGNCKRYARVKVLQEFIAQAKRLLN